MSTTEPFAIKSLAVFADVDESFTQDELDKHVALDKADAANALNNLAADRQLPTVELPEQGIQL